MESLPGLTVAVVTFRAQPRLEWLLDSLANECATISPDHRSKVQLVIVDARLWLHDFTEREGQVRAAVQGRFDLVHVPPKPTPWQGPWRLTRRDYFAAANARNTALAYARHEHVVFCDDMGVLLPGWLSAHLHAAQHGYVLCGLTDKVFDLNVQDGQVISFRESPAGRDSRRAFVTEPGVRPCDPSWVFGGTCSMPIGLAESVNGYDEQTDSCGGEDYDFGIRVSRAGAKVCINSSCARLEVEGEDPGAPPPLRIDKPVPGPDGPYGSNLHLNRILREKTRTWTLGNQYSLRELRASIAAGAPMPHHGGPFRHWVDGQPLSEM